MQEYVNMELKEQASRSQRRNFIPFLVIPLTLLFAFVLVIGVTLTRQLETQPTSGVAADFSLTTYDGTDFRLSEQRGKVVIINFWASWCGPCRSEAPVLQNIWEMYQDRGVEVIGVAYVDIDKNAVAFIEEFGLTYPNGPDIELKISDAYRIQGVPETFVIDQNGSIAQFFLGEITSAKLIPVIDRLISN